MSFVSANGSSIAVSCGPKVLVFREENNKNITLELPAPRPPVKENKPSAKHPPAPIETNVVVGLRFSPCGKWLAAYSSGKQLLVWETEGWTLLSDRDMPKAASSMNFTPDSRAVIIADKAGDAVQFSIQDVCKEGDIILGHLSMLLDVVITPDGKQIITCDRDEKVRVSLYPRAHNIVSYCLGHKEFVSTLSFLPHDSSLLLSGSGDGTIRLWEYSCGKSLSVHDCSPDVTRELTLDPTNLTDMENDQHCSVIVRKVCCCMLDDNSSLVCALVYGYQGFLVYHVVGQSIKFLQSLNLTQKVLDLVFTSNCELIVRSSKSVDNDSFQCYSFDSVSNSLITSLVSANLKQLVCRINEVLNLIDDECVPSSNVPHLVKRRFDNVKDYYELKKARMGEC